MNTTKDHRTARPGAPVSAAPVSAGPVSAGAAGHLALGVLAASGTAFFGLAATGFVTRLAGGSVADAGLPMAVALLVTSLAFAWARRTSPVARFHDRAFRCLLDAQVLVLLAALSGPHPGVMATVAVTFVVLRLLAACALSPTTTTRRA